MENEILESTQSVADIIVETSEPTEVPTETMETAPVYDDFATEPLATEGQAVTLADVYEVRDDIVHADLFGSFLVCGAIIGAVLLRRWR